MRIKKLLAVVLGTVLAISSFSYTSWAAGDDNNSSSVEKFQFVPGYVASELDGNTPVYEDYGMARMLSELPASYPSSVEDIKSKYPDNRNQNPYGTCWAFSSLGLAEFDLINDGAADKNIDLSELALAYYTYNSVTDPLGGTVGDTAKYYNENSDYSYLNRGGNYQYSSRRLAQWIGATENTVPYSKANDTIKQGLSGEFAYSYKDAHLHNVYQINIKENTSGVKEAIMEHGAVGVMYYHSDYNMSWSRKSDCYTYYDTARAGGGHAVMIVGWNDNFSKDNFEGLKPSNDGAWLIRNSWGSYCDYFWMSYDTFSLENTAWVFDFVANDGFDNNYQLDGGIETYRSSNVLSGANVFTTQKKSGIDYEVLKAVSVSMSQAADVKYTVDIYTNLTNLNNPLSGTKQVTATTTGYTQYAGIYTIELSNSIKLAPGTTYSVVVTTDKAALDREDATSMATGEKLETIIWDRRVSQFDGKSFYKEGNVYKYSPNNFCIKAFTSNGKEADTNVPIESIHVNKDTMSLTEGESATLTATISPSNTTLDKTVKWSSSNTAVASVDSAGKVTAKKAGTAVITATSSNGKSASCTVTVKQKDTYTGLRDVNGTLTYFNNGQADKTYTGFVSYAGNNYYVINGVVDTSYTNVTYDGKDWLYVENGKVRYDYTGIRSNESGFWRIDNGKVNFDYYGVAENEFGWWKIEGGKVNFDYYGIAENEFGWWRIEGGKVNFDYYGIAENEFGWWKIEGGKVNFDYYGVAENECGWWKVEGGKVNFDYYGVADNEFGWWRIEGGKVNFDYYGIAENEYGWWKIEGGKVNFDYTGLADSDNGRMYVSNGGVDFGYTNVIQDGDVWVYVENGKVRYDYTGIRENANGWWKIESGIVNFKFTGIASNENGEFYIKDGKVDFDYSGTINQSDCIYTVKSGWVVSKEGISGIIKGVDVSHHNNDNGEGVLNWAEVANAGYKFAMVKVAGRSIGDDGSLYTDKYYEENIKGALSNGLQVGVYFFSQAMSVDEAIEEANYICDLIAGYNISYPVVFDWETTSGYRTQDLRSNSELRTAMSVAFCDTVKNRGYDPMIYINKFDYLNYVDTEKLSSSYDIWLAWYWNDYDETGKVWQEGDKVPNIGYNYRMWQYSSTAGVPGIAGGCDVNIAYGTR